MMTIDTALKIGLNPTRYYADHLRTAYDMLSNLTDRQISDLGVQWYAAVGNLEGALRRLYA